MTVSELDLKFFLSRGIPGRSVLFKDVAYDDDRKEIVTQVWVNRDAGVAKVHQGEPFDEDLGEVEDDLRYFLGYGKPGVTVLVSYDDWPENSPVEIQGYVWVDLDNGIAEAWDWEKSYDETHDIS